MAHGRRALERRRRRHLRLTRIEGSGPVAAGRAVIHLSRCQHCYLWEAGRYGLNGRCRRYPYRAMNAWERCAAWTNRHGRFSAIEAWHPTAVAAAPARAAERRSRRRPGRPAR